MATGSQIVTDFVSTLGKTPGVTVTHSDISQNVFEVDGRFSCLLYVKGRGEVPYTWGVTANVVERLKQQKQRWFTVLLYESRNTGYFLPSADVTHYMMEKVWPLALDGDYKRQLALTLLATNRWLHSMNFLVYLMLKPDNHQVARGIRI